MNCGNRLSVRGENLFHVLTLPYYTHASEAVVEQIEHRNPDVGTTGMEKRDAQPVTQNQAPAH